MGTSNQRTLAEKIADFVFRFKKPLLVLITATTALMLWFATQLYVDAGFKKQLPLQHEFMKTFMDYETEFGGANRLLVAVIDKSGNMFNPTFFQTLEKVTDEIFFIPGVNRSSVRSLFTPNVRFVEVVEDGFAGGNVIPSDFQPTPEMMKTVRGNIVKAGIVGRLVAEDFSGAMIWADLQETDPVTGKSIDYQQVARQLEEIRQKYQNDQIDIHVIGFAKIVGDISEGAKSVLYFFALAIFITALLLYWYSGSIWLTLFPIVSSIIAVIWQLGLLKVLGFGIDPMNILTPFLIFAIGVSHGVQMITGWANEMMRQPEGKWNPEAAARATLIALLAPGIIALLSDTIGFATIYFIDIRIIQELAITATLGVALIIVTNIFLLPILLSMTPIKDYRSFCEKCKQRFNKGERIWRALAAFAKNPGATIAVVVALALGVYGYVQSQKMQIGDSQTGVPELRPDSRYNVDAKTISSKFSLGVDMFNVIAESTPDACTENFDAMNLIDEFAWHMSNVPGVQKVITLPQVAKVINAGWNEGNLKWRALSRNNYVMRQSLANIETDTGLLNKDCSAMPVMVFTADHKATTINRLVKAINEFKQKHPPQYDKAGKIMPGSVNFRMATGNVGVMAATNDVVKAAQMPMLIMVYLAIIVLCLITFRTVAGTLAIVIPLALVSLLAYALMAWLGIGLKVNTLPVVALGVGIGVDYGIYIFSRLQMYLKQGMPLYEAYYETLKVTGKAVLFTAITLAVGVGTWILSDLKFQADMGILLAFMFLLNMIGALVLLPALTYWLMPSARRGRQSQSEAAARVA